MARAAAAVKRPPAPPRPSLPPLESWVSSFADSLRRRTGARRALAAFVLGLIAALASPPTGLFPVLWIAFPGLIFLLQGTPNLGAAFVTGWCFAFGYMVLGLYWIAASMFVDLQHFWWAVPFGVAGLPAGFAIYFGLAAMAARRIGLNGVSGALFFAVLWLLADYAQGHVFSGYPWSLEGYSWCRVLPVEQIASVIGIYSLTLLTLVAAALPACLIQRGQRAGVIISLLLFTVIGMWGGLRLIHANHDTMPDMRLRIVQPNIAQSMKWDPARREANFSRLLELTGTPSDEPVSVVIWPETATPYYLETDANARKAIADILPPASTLLTGEVRRSVDGFGVISYANAMDAFASDENGDGQVLASYDKHHLVPFGEFMPFRGLLPNHGIAGMGIDFTRGPGPQTLRVAGLPPFSPLICFEAIFPAETVDADDRPDWLVNITNDGWYGKLAGPYQHFQIVKVRAIEQGLPLARAANTGISGVFDAYGRVTAKLGLGEMGVLDADLPQSLPPTLYSRYGDVLTGLLCAIILVIAGACRLAGPASPRK